MYSGGCWRSLQHRAAGEHELLHRPQPQGLPLQLGGNNLTQKDLLTGGDGATSQEQRGKGSREKKEEEKQPDTNRGEKGLFFFLAKQNFQKSSRFYFWNPFNNLSSASWCFVEHDFFFFLIWVCICMSSQHFLLIWLCTGHSSSISTPAPEPLNPLWRVSAWVSDCRMNLIQFYRESTILFLWQPIDIVLSLHLKLNFCSIFISITFFWHITPLSKMSHHKNSWKDKVGTSFRSFLIFFSGDILGEKCQRRSVRPCLSLRMAGCTSRCRQGVLKLIQSLQRLVSGTLTKGTLSLQCTFHDGFMGCFPLRFIFKSIFEPITVGLLTYLKHPHNFFL